MRSLKAKRPQPRTGASAPSYPRAIGVSIAFAVAACSNGVNDGPETNGPAGFAQGAWTTTSGGGQGGDIGGGGVGGGVGGTGGVGGAGGAGGGGLDEGGGGVGGTGGGVGGADSGNGGGGD